MTTLPHQDASTEDQLEVIFKGLDKPKTVREQCEYCINGYVFIQQLALVDRLFGLAFEDNREAVEFASSQKNTSEQALKNWQVITVALFDHGVELKEEWMFAIIGGQLAPAAQLTAELHQLNDKSPVRIVLNQVGPAVPARQRVHPFLGQAVPSANANFATTQYAPHSALTGGGGFNKAQSSLGGNASQPPATAVPTKAFMQDSTRFARKRMILADQLEKLRDREVKAQKQRERKEREAQRLAIEAQRNKELAKDLQQQELQIEKSVQLHRSDPSKMAEKKRRTELLKELEALETAAARDGKKLNKMKMQATTPIPLESPRRPSHLNQPRQSPPRIRNETSIPFSSQPKKAQPLRR